MHFCSSFSFRPSSLSLSHILSLPLSLSLSLSFRRKNALSNVSYLPNFATLLATSVKYLSPKRKRGGGFFTGKLFALEAHLKKIAPSSRVLVCMNNLFFWREKEIPRLEGRKVRKALRPPPLPPPPSQSPSFLLLLQQSGKHAIRKERDCFAGAVTSARFFFLSLFLSLPTKKLPYKIGRERERVENCEI